MKIKFYGVRGSIPTPGKNTVEYGGNTTCLEMTANSGDEYIFDAGSGIRELGNELMQRYKGRVKAKVFISHDHWDHIQGFPFFVPAYVSGCQIQVYSGDKEIAKKLGSQQRTSDTTKIFKKDQKNLEEKIKGNTEVSHKSQETNHTKDVHLEYLNCSCTPLACINERR